jgi:NDP-sugar pyrophosphorylase family protein
VDVCDKPFILRIMEQLEDYGFTIFVLCRGEGGTLTALRAARDQLGERFIVLYGDTYLPLDYSKFVAEWETSGLPHACAVRNGIDAGVNGLTDWTLDLLDETDTNLVSLQTELRNRCMTQYFYAPEAWHEVGTPTALEETRQWFAQLK